MTYFGSLKNKHRWVSRAVFGTIDGCQRWGGVKPSGVRFEYSVVPQCGDTKVGKTNNVL